MHLSWTTIFTLVVSAQGQHVRQRQALSFDSFGSFWSLPTTVTPPTASERLLQAYGIQANETYQQDAIAWLESTYYEPLSDARLVQQYALACFHEATDAIANPYTKAIMGDFVLPWLHGDWLQDSNECGWKGVTCNSDGWVIELDLGSALLTGTFPSEIVWLKDTLTLLDLHGNYCLNQGSENDFLGELVNLESLFLQDTPFWNNGIPSGIGKLTKLVGLDLSYTLYFGAWDGNLFANINQLEYLVLNGLDVNGPLPTELVTLPSLKYFYAQYSGLTGDLSWLPSMTSAVEVWIDDNPGFAGSSLPANLDAMAQLQSFSATGCGLSGSMPTSLGNLSMMKQMWLSSNNLNGVIPSTIGDLDSLVTFQVQGNVLTGAMPDEVCDNVYPQGLVRRLVADCDGEMECPCCTCCGENCSIVAPSRRM